MSSLHHVQHIYDCNIHLKRRYTCVGEFILSRNTSCLSHVSPMSLLRPVLARVLRSRCHGQVWPRMKQSERAIPLNPAGRCIQSPLLLRFGSEHVTSSHLPSKSPPQEHSAEVADILAHGGWQRLIHLRCTALTTFYFQAKALKRLVSASRLLGAGCSAPPHVYPCKRGQGSANFPLNATGSYS